ncbi:phosphatidylinositol kinase [Mucilaginibacter limnophilus]|uniref:Phosphatidylinositol kinase n=1 Tax=Mucilaginibacter limnophilus TaxID=1932778 RepID=A0A3S2UQL3_9SPHI|nr:HipA N-terminal domain-containing protein [Mucilaginibacter limnophilus]RVU02071.1 phosphatidylinositol kinase [Mucilaginibacter limnophilus]
MRTAQVFFKDEEAGILSQLDDGSFNFIYNPRWVDDGGKPPISLTLPKRRQAYHSAYLFPFFYNMLPEGSNKQVVCKMNRLDQNDAFGLLVTIAKDDTIGAITVRRIANK